MGKRSDISKYLLVVLWSAMAIKYLAAGIHSVTVYSDYKDYISSSSKGTYMIFFIATFTCVAISAWCAFNMLREKLSAFMASLIIYGIDCIAIFFLAMKLVIGDLSLLFQGEMLIFLLICVLMYTSVFLCAAQFKMCDNGKNVGGAAFIPLGIYGVSLLLRLIKFGTLGDDAAGTAENLIWLATLLVSGIYLFIKGQESSFGAYGYSGMNSAYPPYGANNMNGAYPPYGANNMNGAYPPYNANNMNNPYPSYNMPPAGGKICSSCGSPVIPGSQFCARCGNKII